MEIDPFEWTCLHCDRHQIVTGQNYQYSLHVLNIGNTKFGFVGVTVSAIRCSNLACNEVTLAVEFVAVDYNVYNVEQSIVGSPISSWQLRPESSAKPQPDYIPKPLRDDYLEACLIRDKSPKASATLARRCLQGMIRDFCGISKSRLIDEIAELRKRVEGGTAPRGVEPETVEAIDAVRGIGNIGAHMERDIGMIVDVDPGEAQALVELVELLFDEWYLARHERQQRLSRVQEIAAEKKATLEAMRKEAAESTSPSEADRDAS